MSDSNETSSDRVRERPSRIRISSSDIGNKQQDDFYIDDDIPDSERQGHKQHIANGSLVDMLENLSTDDENELRVSFGFSGIHEVYFCCLKDNWDEQLELEWDDSLIDTPLSNVR